MNYRKLVLRLLLVLNFIGIYVFRITRQVDYYFVFDVLINTSLGIVAWIVSLLVVVGETKNYRQNGLKLNFLPTTMVLYLCLGLVTTLYLLAQRDKSPTVLYFVSKIIDFNGVAVDLRADSTYKVTSWCLGADYYRGKYRMYDSLIILDEKIDVLASTRYVLENDTNAIGYNKVGKSVYPINRYGFIDRGQLGMM